MFAAARGELALGAHQIFIGRKVIRTRPTIVV